MFNLLSVFLVLASKIEVELFEKGSINTALEMEPIEDIDYALKYFLFKNFKRDLEAATFTALAAPQDNEIMLLLLARANSQNSSLYLPPNTRAHILHSLGASISDLFFENKYDFREAINLQSLHNLLDAKDVLKNLKGRDEHVLARFYYYIDARVYLLKDVINELKYLAGMKDINAYCFLGQAYLTGTGVEKDTDKAFEYFWAGKEDNRSAAFLGIGKLFLMDEYKHEESAINAFKLARLQGNNAEAEYCLHLLVEKNVRLADCMHLKHAAMGGYLPAVHKYTELYLEQGQVDSAIYSAMSITAYAPFIAKYDNLAFQAFERKDYRVAAFIYLFLAEFNIPMAVSNAVFLLENHRVYENQDSLLFELYKQLALTNPLYNKNIGDCYFYGRGVEQSLESAFYSYLASKSYTNEGAYCTAYMYETGMGIPKNLYEALRIIKKYIKKESLYLVRFYSLLRINLKILYFHHKILFSLVVLCVCILLGWFRLCISNKNK